MAAAFVGACAAAFALETASPPPPPAKPGPDINQATPNANQALTAWSAGMPEILKMLDAKVDPEVIKAYIKNSPFGYHPTAEELIALRDRGASPDILKALLEHGAQPGNNMAAPVTAPNTPAVAPQGAYPNYDYGYPDYAAYPYYGYYPSYPYYYDYWWPSVSFAWYWPWYWNSGRFFHHDGFFAHRFDHGFRGAAFGGHSFGPGRGGGGFHGGFVGHSGGFGGHTGGFAGHAGGFGGHGGGFGGHGGGGFGGHGGGGHR